MIIPVVPLPLLARAMLIAELLARALNFKEFAALDIEA
jgi:hypothetical protein